MGALDTLPRRKLSVDDFRRMGEAGILGEDDRIELIEGEMIEKAPIGPLPAAQLNILGSLLVRTVGDRATVSIQNPIVLPPQNEPQPDIALLRQRADRYRRSLPSAVDVLLIIEVADTTLRCDRDIKIPLYARHGIPELWIVDLPSEAVLVYRQPGADGYGEASTAPREGTLSPQAFPGVALNLEELWRR